MEKEQVFYICETCGNLVGMVNNANVPLVCCGSPMKELKPNSTDAAQEKHVPVAEVTGDQCKVAIGSAAHPMTDEHRIAWVYLKTEKGGQRKNLAAGEAPEAVFGLVGDKALAVYAYCNLHGLWKAEV
jgi:superoxide reductase